MISKAEGDEHSEGEALRYVGEGLTESCLFKKTPLLCPIFLIVSPLWFKPLSPCIYSFFPPLLVPSVSRAFAH